MMGRCEYALRSWAINQMVSKSGVSGDHFDWSSVCLSPVGNGVLRVGARVSRPFTVRQRLLPKRYRKGRLVVFDCESDFISRLVIAIGGSGLEA